MNRPPATAFALAVLLLAGLSANGAESPSPPPPASAKPAPKPADPAKPNVAAPSAPGGVQTMEREFGERSQALIEKRKGLLDRLRLAKTEEEKQRIIAELRQQQQERLEQQREAARLIREQMQNKRPATPGR